MRAITVVQAFQYWVKLFAIAVPAFVLCMVFFAGGGPDGLPRLGAAAPPVFTHGHHSGRPDRRHAARRAADTAALGVRLRSTAPADGPDALDRWPRRRSPKARS